MKVKWDCFDMKVITVSNRSAVNSLGWGLLVISGAHLALLFITHPMQTTVESLVSHWDSWLAIIALMSAGAYCSSFVKVRTTGGAKMENKTPTAFLDAATEFSKRAEVNEKKIMDKMIKKQKQPTINQATHDAAVAFVKEYQPDGFMIMAIKDGMIYTTKKTPKNTDDAVEMRQALKQADEDIQEDIDATYT